MNSKKIDEMSEEEYNQMVSGAREFLKNALPADVRSFIVVYTTDVGYGDLGSSVSKLTTEAMRLTADHLDETLNNLN